MSDPQPPLAAQGDTIHAANSQGYINRPAGDIYQTWHLSIQRLPQPKPRMLPHTDGSYVPRVDRESVLSEGLQAASGQKPVLLWGMSGTGKTSLATHVIQALSDSYPDGVLWASLDQGSAADVLSMLLGAIDREWYLHQRAGDSPLPLRDAFWSNLVDKRALVVLDGLADDTTLAQLLPTSGIPRQCTLLIIATSRLRFPRSDAPLTIELGGLTLEQALDLFRKHLSDEQMRLAHHHLEQIARLLEYNPLLLTMAALDIRDGAQSAGAFARALHRHGSGPDRALSRAQEGLDLVLGSLSPSQADLFDFIGVFDHASWTLDALAAAAVRRVDQTRADLMALVSRGLVQSLDGERYAANAIVRSAARTRLHQRPSIIQHASNYCLARYYLDLTEDLSARLDAQDGALIRNSRIATSGPMYVEHFRDDIVPELPHIRRALAWASEHDDWSTLRRFADVACAEVLDCFSATGFEIRLDLILATLIEPMIRAEKDTIELGYQAFVSSSPWVAEGHEEQRELDTSSGATRLSATAQATATSRRCEASINIAGGQIRDGAFTDMCLTHTDWLGVRAHRVVFRNADIISSRFIACDFTSSVWSSCDARQLALRGCIIRQSVMRDVKLQSADLRGVDFRGAILERVRLRGADLSNANLAGATLNQVDLRDANLSNADLRGASLIDIDLRGSTYTDARWESARFANMRWNDPAEEAKLKALANGPEATHTRAERNPIPRSLDDNDLSGDDLRGIQATRLTAKPRSIGKRLQGASFDKVDLAGVKLGSADLQAMRMSEGSLAEADLRDANLLGASLKDMPLQKAKLTGAALRSALLRGADLRDAILTGADLRDADLRDADLRDADLRGALLSRADLRNARLQGANLSGADISGADLRGATYEPSQLARAARRHGALTDGGRIVAIASAQDFEQATYLDFAHISLGSWTKEHLAKRKLPYVELAGACMDSSFADTDMPFAQFSGTYSDTIFDRIQAIGTSFTGSATKCSFQNASLQNSQLHGRFIECHFNAADLQDVSFKGAFLCHVDFRGASNFSEATLKEALSLRDVTFPDGIRYQGQFQLSEDIRLASARGINIHDADEMFEHYYGVTGKLRGIIPG